MFTDFSNTHTLNGHYWWIHVQMAWFHVQRCFLITENDFKKRCREMQTLRGGCSKAEPKNFAPPQTPFPGAWNGQNLISWRWSPPLPTNPVWWGSMHAISSYCDNRPTHTDRTDYNALQLFTYLTKPSSL